MNVGLDRSAMGLVAGRDGRDEDGSGISLPGWERAVEARVAGCAQDALEENLRPEVRVRRSPGAEVTGQRSHR
jgi:hypothetical protein